MISSKWHVTLCLMLNASEKAKTNGQRGAKRSTKIVAESKVAMVKKLLELCCC